MSLSISTAEAVKQDVARDTRHDWRPGVGGVALRRFPYPYRAALAIASDIDETKDVDEFLAIQRFLNTTQETSMGRGLGLEIDNSFYFYDDENEFSYFNHDERTQRVIVELIQAGYIDCLHTYGDSTGSRDDVLRALDELNRNDCRLDVWVNHYGSRNNFCRKFEYFFGPCEGDDTRSDIYHADVTLSYGIRFAWVGAYTRKVGQSPGGTCRLTSAADWRHPIVSSLNMLKEERKHILGRWEDERFVLYSQNALTQPLTLGDGGRVHEFIRYCNHPVSVAVGGTSRGLAYLISNRVLRHLKRSQGTLIAYAHLGKNSDCDQPVAVETQAALRALECEYRDGAIYVTTTSRLLNYHRAWQYLDWTWQSDGRQTRIHIHRIADPLFPQHEPTAADLGGLTFYVPRADTTEIFAGALRIQNLRRNPADDTGSQSVSIAVAPLQFPL